MKNASCPIKAGGVLDEKQSCCYCYRSCRKRQPDADDDFHCSSACLLAGREEGPQSHKDIGG